MFSTHLKMVIPPVFAVICFIIPHCTQGAPPTSRPTTGPTTVCDRALERLVAGDQAAACILQLDARKDGLNEAFGLLNALASRKPTDPLVLWMFAVECRTFRQNDPGALAYADLCKLWKPGPVLVHQSYANILDDLKRYDEALLHRELAVRLEPEPWSYDGLGNTLTNLKRWKDADAAFSRSTALDPNDPQYWRNWAISKRKRGDADGAATLFAKANALDKARPESK